MINTRNKYILYIGVILIYQVLSWQIGEWISTSVFNIMIRPLACFALIAWLLKMPKVKSQIRKKEQSFLLLICIAAGISFVVFNLLLGTVEGFGKNPYDVSLKGILTNIWSFYPHYLLYELVRERIVGGRKENFFALYSVVIVYTLLSFTPSQWSAITTNNLQQNVEFLGSGLMPTIVLQVLLCQTSRLGGWKPTYILKLFYESMFFFFAVLPDLEWLTKAIVNSLFPLFTYYILTDLMEKKERSISKLKRERDQHPIATMITYIVSIMVVWFSVGVFPVFPTLVLTGSMEPFIQPGDIVIMARTETEKIVVDDIIQFRVDDYDVIHRVIELEDSRFKTKGDNNNTADNDLVDPGMVRGKYLFHVPKMGSLSLYFKTQFQKELEDRVSETYELGSEEQ